MTANALFVMFAADLIAVEGTATGALHLVGTIAGAVTRWAVDVGLVIAMSLSCSRSSTRPCSAGQ